MLTAKMMNLNWTLVVLMTLAMAALNAVILLALWNLTGFTDLMSLPPLTVLQAEASGVMLALAGI